MQFAKKLTAVCVGVSSHTMRAGWGEFGKFGNQPTTFIKKFFGFVALQPGFEHRKVLGMSLVNRKRYLV